MVLWIGMDKLFYEQDLGVAGTLHLSLENVYLDGETDGYMTFCHEAAFAEKLSGMVENVGGRVTGDAALF
mgnify:CR=1 FL=1